MRIAYVNYGTQSGVTPNILRAVSDLGHEITSVNPTQVLALRDPRTRRPRPTPRVLLSVAAGLARHGRQGMYHRWNTVYAFDQHSREAARLLREMSPRPDVVLQNGALFAPGNPPPFPYVLLLDNTCLLAERQPAVPEAGMGPHVKFGPRWIARERAAYQRASAIATFSSLVKDSLVRDYGVDPGRVLVTGAGANVQPLEGMPREDDGRTLVFVGKDGWPRKGGPVLLRAFAILRKQFPDLKLLIAGPTERIEMPEGATNLGLVPFAEVERLLRRATVFVLPTLREPYGIAYLDAMLCGAPCVGTMVGAVPEILGDAGIVVPPAEPEFLARAIAELLNDPARRAAMGEAGRRRVLERGWIWSEVGRRVAGLLDEAAQAERRRRRRESAIRPSRGMPSHADWSPVLLQPPEG